MDFNAQNCPVGHVIFPTPTYFSETQFFGREADVERIKQFLGTDSSVAISGKRRIGRSWFLQHLRQVLSVDRYITVYSDEIKPDTIVPRLSRLFLSALVDALESTLRKHVPQYQYTCQLLNFDQPPANIGSAFRTDLRNLHEILVGNNLIAVILIDEIEAIHDFTDESGIVPAIIRSLATEYQNIRVIVAGFNLQSNVGTQRSLFDAFSHHQLYGIGVNGASRLVVEQLAQYGICFQSNQVWENIYYLSGGEPSLLRLLGQQLVEQARSNSGVIGQNQVNDAVEQLFGMQQVSSMMNFAWFFLGDNQPIHALASVLAYNPKITALKLEKLLEETRRQYYANHPTEVIRNDLQRLHSLGFLHHDSAQDCSTFSSEFLRLWICRHRLDPGIHV